MKRRAIVPITIGVSVLALALLIASGTPAMRITSADTERVTLETDGDCAFHLSIPLWAVICLCLAAAAGLAK